jgi:RecA-family ATPase
MSDVPDRDEAERFLTALDPNTDRFTFQTFDDDPDSKDGALARILHGTLARHWDALVELNERGAGIFVTVNVTDFKGRSIENIVRVRAVFADLDGAPLDPVLAEGMPKPHIVTETSLGRWHAYWRVTEDMPLDEFGPLQQGIIARLDSDKSVHDLPRVMRIPGFIHRKADPFVSMLLQTNDVPPYDWHDLRQAFPLPAPPEPEPPRPPPADDRDMPDQWRRLNSDALANLSAWVPNIFPGAKRYHEGYRVSSKNLRRNFEEDLSFRANGICDFGVADMGDPSQGRRTPIDVVMEHSRTDFPGAVRLLALALGRNPKDYEPRRKGNGAAPDDAPPPPLHYVDLALDLVPRQWLVLDRIPMLNVSLLSGEGAIGKSLLVTQLSAAVVLGKDWIGTLPEPGPVLYVSCEEDDDEIRRRMEAVAVHFGSSRAELIERGLRVVSLAGKDATLGWPDKHGIIRATPLLHRLRRDALLQRPKLIVLDAAADVFGGKEIDRAQTRQFITLQRGLAIEVAAAVVMIAHPSLTGISSDTGLSGSTAWHNSVRARMYFKTAPGDDTALRVLEVKKNNYGPVTEGILLRWKNGVYVPEPGKGTLQRLAAEAEINQLFIKLLRRFTEQGRNVSDNKSPTYAPSLFAKEPEAKEAKATKQALEEAMARLFGANRLRVVTIGSASRMRSRIVEVGATTEAATVLPFPTPIPTPFQQPSNGVLAHTPHTPQCVGRGKGALEAPAPSNTEQAGGIPFMITRAMRSQLQALGFSDEEISNMTPAQAHALAAPHPPANSQEGVYRPRTADGYEVIGPEPEGSRCSQCGKSEGAVYLIRDPFKGVRSEPLHEGCARLWFARRDA